jgi:hypothetical protein
MRSFHSCLVFAALLLPAELGDPAPAVPSLLIGRFVDDYGIVHGITDTSWSLGQRDRYRIVFSDDSAQYLIARNDSANTADAGKWTRIDWILLPNMAPYEWAFCLIEYKAETRALAEANRTAERAHPRTGCNGFPFSRMQRTSADSAQRRY